MSARASSAQAPDQRRRRLCLGLLALAGLAGCGRKGALEPPPGAEPPPDVREEKERDGGDGGGY